MTSPSKSIRTVLQEEEAPSSSQIPSRHVVHSPLYTTSMTYASAGLANVISACCTNPADVIKVRQQLLKDRARASFLSIGSMMIKSEGPLSLWSGVTAACLREATYSTIRMGGYEPMKRFYRNQIGLPDTSFSNKLLAGITSGAIGALISSPTDLMKIRMQAARPNGVPPYKTSFHGFVQVYQQSGIRGLWRGVAPNTIRAAVLTSSQIATYDQVKGWFKSTIGIKEGLGLHFSASMVAGFVCSAASQPIDTIKVRLMSRPSIQGVKVSSMTHLSDLLKNEGPLALWKGFGMCWARLGSHTVISLILFEAFRGLFGVKPL
ncbi:unnamed protein product [Sympodiomycopsis kandeliae]